MRRAEEQAAELRIAEARLLWLLTGDGPARKLKQIAGELELEQSTANRQVNAAVRAGLVRRFHAVGAHAWLFKASAEERALYESSARRHLGRVSTALAALPQDERARLIRAFAPFTASYAELSPIEDPTRSPSEHTAPGKGPMPGRTWDGLRPALDSLHKRPSLDEPSHRVGPFRQRAGS